jgi:hypothetical protein
MCRRDIWWKEASPARPGSADTQRLRIPLRSLSLRLIRFRAAHARKFIQTAQPKLKAISCKEIFEIVNSLGNTFKKFRC